MANPGESLRKVWTAKFYNELREFMESRSKIIGSGGLTAAVGPKGIQLQVPPPRAVLSTIQGVLVGGSSSGVTDGTDVIDPYAWSSYSIQGAMFVLQAGSTAATVLINGTPVSWLTSISVTTSNSVISIPSPAPDLTHIVPVGGQLSVQLVGSSGTAAGFLFSLNCPF
jgi:hypothetical protein